MGFLVYFPENHGAMLGASRMATDLIPYANAPKKPIKDLAITAIKSLAELRLP